MSSRTRLLVFESKDEFLRALKILEVHGSAVKEALSPFDLRNDPAFSKSKAFLNPVKVATLAGAILGVVSGFFLVWYSAVVDAPLNVGGKPMNSWPVTVPLMWIFAVLMAGLGGFSAFLWRLKFPQLSHPIFDFPQFELHKDQFYIWVSSSMNQVDLSNFDAQIIEGTPE